MNKKLILLPILALAAMTGCGGSKGPKEPTHDGKSAATAYTVEEMHEVMKDYAAGDISQEEYYVKSKLAAGSTYAASYGSWTAYDEVHHKEATDYAFQFYSCQMDESITKNYKGDGCLDGATIVVHGYAQLYQPSEGNPVFEICYLSKSKSPTGEAVSPVIVSVEGGTEYVQPDATAMSIGNNFELAEGGTKQLSATFTPADGKHADVTWASNAAGVATVSNAGLVTAVAAGEATITATAGSLTASVTVTVKSVLTAITVDAGNLLGYTDANVPYPSDATPVTATINGYGFAAVGCGCYGDGIQMRTKNGITSAVYNTDAVAMKSITLNWAATKDITAGKDYHVFVEFSNAADFSELVGEKINAQFVEKALTVTPTANANYMRVTHANMGAVYLDSIVLNLA